VVWFFFFFYLLSCLAPGTNTYFVNYGNSFDDALTFFPFCLFVLHTLSGLIWGIKIFLGVGWGCSSVTQLLLSTFKFLGLIPSTNKQTKKGISQCTHGIGEFLIILNSLKSVKHIKFTHFYTVFSLTWVSNPVKCRYLDKPPGQFSKKLTLFFSLFIYSNVHTLFESFLTPAPCTLPLLPPTSLPSRTCSVLFSNFVEE
jgi:hypothetical protein